MASKVWWVGAALAVLAGCGASEAACTEACARPFELAREEAAVQAAAWGGMPEPQRAAALAVHSAWKADVDAAQSAFATQCVPVCRKRAPAVVECLQRARNSGEWKACGGAPPAAQGDVRSRVAVVPSTELKS